MGKIPRILSGVGWVMGCGYDGYILNDHPHKSIPHKTNDYFYSMKVVLYLLGPGIRFQALTKPALTSSKSAMETPQQCVKSAQV